MPKKAKETMPYLDIICINTDDETIFIDSDGEVWFIPIEDEKMPG
jgi:hypothetical protein